MFKLLGVGERAGSGLKNIHLVWKEQKWIVPDLEESYVQIELHLRKKQHQYYLKKVLRNLNQYLKRNIQN
jgi:UTP-glucose-1-phosphate uridylyltransferase